VNYQVYPNAPLALAAVEVRYPYTPGLASHSRIAALQELLSDVAPLAEPAFEKEIPLAMASVPVDRQLLRFRSRDQSTAVTITDTNVIVESAAYPGYPAYRPLLDLVLRALTKDRLPVGLQRIGLRYINEVRAPDVASPTLDWQEWLEPTLLAPANFQERVTLPVRSWQGLVQFDHGLRGGLVLRYGPGEGYAVDRSAIKRPGPSQDGHFFLLDLDSYWEAPADDIPAFDAGDVLALCDRLHDPIKSVFECSLSDKLRDQVLKKWGTE